MKPWLFIFASLFAGWVQAQPDSDRQKAISHIVVQDCGSCHGLQFKGGLGPSLLPEDLAGKPKEYLFVTIKYGRDGSAMPPWSRFFNDEEIHWMVDQLQKGGFHEKP